MNVGLYYQVMGARVMKLVKNPKTPENDIGCLMELCRMPFEKAYRVLTIIENELKKRSAK